MALPDTKQLTDWLTSLIIETRNRRKEIEQGWLNIHAGWYARNMGRQQYKSDTFSYYIPQFRRTIERTVTRARKILLPKPNFFEVSPLDAYDAQASRNAESVHAFQNYFLKKRGKISQLVGMLIRNLLMYTIAVQKTTVEVYTHKGMPEVWPRIRAVDPFSYYIYPETAIDPEDRIMCFEDHMMPWQEYDKKAEGGLVTPVNRQDLDKPVWPYHHQQRLTQQGVTIPSEMPQAEQPPENFVALTEVWFKANKACYQAWILWNLKTGPKIVLGPRPSRYGHAPYRDAFARPVVGETYTNSMGHDLEPLQIWLNDTINEMEEARTTAALPPVAIPNEAIGRTETIKYGPRRRWDVNPEMVKMLDIPDTSTGSLRVMQVVMGLINSVSGSNTMSEGQPGRNMPRAGFAVNSLLQLGMADTEDVAQIIESEILGYMLGDIHATTQVFVPPSQIFRIPGTQDYPARHIGAEQLAGDYEFEWVGSLASQDSQQRAQKVMSLLPILLNMMPLLAQQGLTVNWQDLMRTVWRDVLGERGLNTILRKMTPQEQQQMMMQQMAEQGGPGQMGMPGVAGGPEDIQRQMSAMMGGGMAG